MNLRRQRELCAALLLSFTLSAACGGDEGEVLGPPPTNPAATSAAAAAAAKPAEPQKPLTDEYIFTPIGKRDPFRSILLDTEARESQRRKKTPLEQFDLDQLKLVGVVTGISAPRAMIQGPDRRGYPAGIGTPIGKHGGKVSQIRRNELQVTEEYRDFYGKTHAKSTLLKMSTDDLNMQSGGSEE